jgi:hypothetical protein
MHRQAQARGACPRNVSNCCWKPKPLDTLKTPHNSLAIEPPPAIGRSQPGPVLNLEDLIAANSHRPQQRSSRQPQSLTHTAIMQPTLPQMVRPPIRPSKLPPGQMR